MDRLRPNSYLLLCMRQLVLQEREAASSAKKRQQPSLLS
jgi:hypothetical protein